MITVLLIGSTAFSQWSAGPRVGVNFSTLTGQWDSNDQSQNKFQPGLLAGAAGGYSFSDLLSVRLEVLYVSLATKTVSDETSARAMNEQYFLRERFNCLQLIALTYFMWTVGSINLFAFPAIYWLYKFGGTITTPYGTLPVRWAVPPRKSPAEDYYYLDPAYNRRSDFGMQLGGGVGKKLGPGRMELDVRFGFGFVDLNKFDSKDEKQQAKDDGYKPYRHLNFSVALAYMFLFDKKN